MLNSYCSNNEQKNNNEWSTCFFVFIVNALNLMNIELKKKLTTQIQTLTNKTPSIFLLNLLKYDILIYFIIVLVPLYTYQEACTSSSQCDSSKGLSCPTTAGQCNCPTTSTAYKCDCPSGNFK